MRHPKGWREVPKGQMTACRECRQQVSVQAFACPHCGAPYPARERRDGWGYEYKSRTTIAGLPLLHVSFKYRPNYRPVPARGIIAIGQFGMGVINISQFGVGIISISQFAVAAFAVAQFGIAWSLIAQVGLYVERGYGQVVRTIASLFGA